MKLPLSRDPLAGTTTYFVDQPHEDRFYVQTVQDVEPLLDRNQALANDPDYTRAGIKSGWAHAASIPATIQHKLLIEYSGGRPGVYMDDGYWEFVKRKVMTDPDYARFRTAPKTLMRKARA